MGVTFLSQNFPTQNLLICVIMNEFCFCDCLISKIDQNIYKSSFLGILTFCGNIMSSNVLKKEQSLLYPCYPWGPRVGFVCSMKFQAFLHLLSFICFPSFPDHRCSEAKQFLPVWNSWGVFFHSDLLSPVTCFFTQKCHLITRTNSFSVPINGSVSEKFQKKHLALFHGFRCQSRPRTFSNFPSSWLLDVISKLGLSNNTISYNFWWC